MKLIPARTSALIVVALAMFTDTLLYYLLVPLLPAYARQYGLNQMGIGILFGSYAAALLLGTVPLGKLADRMGRRTPMIGGLLGLFATTLLFAFARSYPLLILARILQGLSATATWTAGMALVADHFPQSARGRAMGTVFACANLGVLLGPALSGWLDQHYGLRAPFLAAAGLALVDALARFTLLKDVPAVLDTRMGFLDLMKNPTIRVFAGAMAMGASLLALLESTLPLHLDAVLKLAPTSIGLCFGAAAVTHMISSPLMGALSDRVGRRKVLVTGLLLAMVAIPLPVFMTGIWGVALAMGCIGVITTLILSPASPAMADAVERMGSDSYGSVFGILNIAFALGMMAGPLVGSALVQALGIRAALVGMGLAFGAYAIWVVRVGAAPLNPGGPGNG
jgi:multidrug resistance protein